MFVRSDLENIKEDVTALENLTGSPGQGTLLRFIPYQAKWTYMLIHFDLCQRFIMQLDIG